MADALPTLPEIIERSILSAMKDVLVSMPGEIVSYDAATRTATVKPCLRRVVPSTDDTLAAEELPPLRSVPVVWPGSAAFNIHGGLAAGDTGDLIVASWSMNEWRGSGAVSTPGDTKPHGLAGAKFYPGLYHKKNTPADTDNSIGLPSGLRIHFTESAVVVGSGAQFVALAALVEARLSALETFATNHTHATAGTGPPVPAAPPFTPSGVSVAASNLKADP